MITTEDARLVAAEWRPRFIDETAFEESWKRFFAMVGDPTIPRLEQWLDKDRHTDEVRATGISREPLLPTRSRFELSTCRHCAGHRYVRHDVEISHPDFGKAHPCPGCNR